MFTTELVSQQKQSPGTREPHASCKWLLSLPSAVHDGQERPKPAVSAVYLELGVWFAEKKIMFGVLWGREIVNK